MKVKKILKICPQVDKFPEIKSRDSVSLLDGFLSGGARERAQGPPALHLRHVRQVLCQQRDAALPQIRACAQDLQVRLL